MKMPTVVRAIEDELATGHVAVVQLTSTAEAILGRRLADLSPEERANLSIDVSPLDTLIDYLRTAFPTRQMRSEEHTSELQSLMRRSYAAFCLKKKNKTKQQNKTKDRTD